MRLRDKVVVITGSGSGMGRRIAQRFAEEGANVVVSGIHDENGLLTVDRIVSAGGTASYVHCNILDEKDIRLLVSAAVKTYGRLDVLVAHAADKAAWIGANVIDTTPEQFDRAMAAVPRASFLLANYAIPEMIRSGGGSIVFTSSIRALNGSTNFLMYNLSKSTLAVLAKCIALDYGPQGIRCNCIAPGVVQSQLEDDDLIPDTLKARYLAACYPLRRLGRTKDIANAAVFLASDEASWVTGQTLVVDGGITSQSQDDLANRMAAFLKGSPEILDGL